MTKIEVQVGLFLILPHPTPPEVRKQFTTMHLTSHLPENRDEEANLEQKIIKLFIMLG